MGYWALKKRLSVVNGVNETVSKKVSLRLLEQCFRKVSKATMYVHLAYDQDEEQRRKPRGGVTSREATLQH